MTGGGAVFPHGPLHGTLVVVELTGVAVVEVVVEVVIEVADEVAAAEGAVGSVVAELSVP